MYPFYYSFENYRIAIWCHDVGGMYLSRASLDGDVISFVYQSDKGLLTAQQVISSLPPDFKGSSTGAEILVSPDGKYLYGSNRGHDSIAIFKIGDTGLLTPVGWETAGGTLVQPRGVGISPDGNYLLVTSQTDNTVTTFRISTTGTLQKIMSEKVPTQPSWVGVLPLR